MTAQITFYVCSFPLVSLKVLKTCR